MGQDTHRFGRRRGRGWNWNWYIEGGRSGGMEEYKFARKHRERIITMPCMLLGKSFIFSVDLRRPEASNVTLSFSLLRSSCHFYFTCHRIDHFSHALYAFGHPRPFAFLAGAHVCQSFTASVASSSPGCTDRYPMAHYRRAEAFSLVATYLFESYLS